MTVSIEDREYFRTSGLKLDAEVPFPTRLMENIVPYLRNALQSPARAHEFELFTEYVLLNNFYDPEKNDGYEEAGIPEGRNGAIDQIRNAYSLGIGQSLNHLELHIKHNGCDYTAKALSVPESNKHGHFLENALFSFKRFHQGKGMDYMLDPDELAWKEVGFASAAAFQHRVREAFKSGKVGSSVLAELNPKGSDASRSDELSIKAADYRLRHIFPELADRLGIPTDIGKDLLSAKNEAAAISGQARDFCP